MADSYHIIDGKVVPYSGGRKCNDTDAWRDATPLELQLQEQLEEYEHANAAKDAEIEALRAEVGETKEVAVRAMRQRDAQYNRAERLAEALRRYGAHDQACVAANIPICTCGLDAALEQEAGRG